jgi:hypothetical protein
MSARRDLLELSKELQAAGIAAILLALSLLLPWYQKSVVAPGGRIVQGNLSALGVFTFVEAAVLLVAVAVLFLVWARSQRKGFHLPGGDGVAVTLAGGWALLLLVWRLFDKPGIQGQGQGATIGIQWGVFGALLAAGALVATGARLRAAHRPEPPNPVAEDDGSGWVAPPRRDRAAPPDRRPRDAAVSDLLRDRPPWEEPGRSDARTTRLPEDRSEGRTTRLPDDRSRAETTRLPEDRSEARTSRLPDDPSRAETTRLPDDRSEARTSRLPDDPSRAETTRLPDDPPRRPPPDDRAETQRLWDDDEPPRPRR